MARKGFIQGRGGRKKHYLYSTWNNMRFRCLSTKCKQYDDYGGRGIGICEEWDEFFTFADDIDRLLGPRPEGLSLDRIDNDKGYSPDNVRWATRAVQNNNTRVRKPQPERRGKGFNKQGNGWQARISVHGKELYLGYFPCPLLARLAYEDALKELAPYSINTGY